MNLQYNECIQKVWSFLTRFWSHFSQNITDFHLLTLERTTLQADGYKSNLFIIFTASIIVSFIIQFTFKPLSQM